MVEDATTILAMALTTMAEALSHTWAREVAEAVLRGAGYSPGEFRVEVAVLPDRVQVVVHALILGRYRVWVAATVRPWNGSEEWHTYEASESDNLRAELRRKLAARHGRNL